MVLYFNLAIAALNFNNGNFVRIEDSPSLDITAQITLEAWIYKTWNGEDWNIIFSKPWDYDGNPWHVYRLGITDVGDVPKYATCSLALVGGVAGVGGTSVIPDNTWVHLACTYDGSAMKMYVNGNLEGITPASGAINTNNQPVIIGRNFLNTWNDWFGNIDDVRIWNVARSAQEIWDSMNRRLTGAETGLAGYWKFDEWSGTAAADASGNSNTGTLNGNPTWVIGGPLCTPTPSGLISWWGGDNNALDLAGTNDGAPMNGATYGTGRVGQAFSFDGVDDYVNVPNSPSWNFGTNNFSIDFWVNFNSVNNPGYNNFIGHDEGGGSSNKWIFYLKDGLLKFHINGGSTGSHEFGSHPFLPVPGTWYHLALTKDGSIYKFFVNGGLVDTYPAATPSVPDANASLTIGQSENLGYINGLMDEVEIFNRALGTDEITAIYNAGSAGNCRPCAPPPSGLVSWWGGNDNALDIVGTNNGTLQGSATYASGKVGQAFSFDGDGDFVRVLNPQNIPTGNSPRTIVAWINSTGQVNANGNTNTYQGIFGYGPLNPQAGEALFFERAGDNSQPYVNRLFQMNLLAGGAGTSIIEYNTWYHVVLTHDGTATKLYVNGQLENTTNMTHNTVISDVIGLLIGTSPPFDGWHASFKGLIDEVQVFNRALFVDEISSIYNAGSTGQCPIRYFVTAKATGNGAGTVQSNVGGVNYTYPAIATWTTSARNFGTGVILTAAASTGSTVAWTTCTGTAAGNGTSQATCTYTGLNGNKTAEATFTLNTYTVTANAQGNGTGTVGSNVGGVSYNYPAGTTGTTSDLNHGTNVVLTATASTGSTVAWTTCTGTATGNGTATATCTYASLDGGKTAAATFTLNTYTVTANAQGNGGGTVQSNVGGVSYSYQAVNTGTTSALNHGTNVMLTATASTGSTVAWTTCTGTASGNGTASATCTYASLNGNKTAAAAFTLNTYTLTVTPSGAGSGSIKGNGIDCSWENNAGNGTCGVSLDYNTAVSLTAAPRASSLFSGWSGGSGSAAGCSGAGACAFNLTEVSGIGSIFTRISSIYLPLILRL